MQLIDLEQVQAFFDTGGRLIDVRAPIEFRHSSIPNSINLPLLNDDEREQVGICYKRDGQEAAIELGHNLVSGVVREKRVRSWCLAIGEENISALLCARGGKRSEISQQWISQTGIELPRILGGHKALRRSYLDRLEQIPRLDSFVVLTGYTGSAKTKMLQEASNRLPVLDLEDFAHHRGSAFGRTEIAQPSQATFENRIAQKLISLSRQGATTYLLEDESRQIGSCQLPAPLYWALLQAPILLVQVELEERVDNIFQDYVVRPLELLGDELLEERYLESIDKISRPLGGKRVQELTELLTDAFAAQELEAHKQWIRYLLADYYDPYYEKHISKHADRIVFKGNYDELNDCLEELFERFSLRKQNAA